MKNLTIFWLILTFFIVLVSSNNTTLVIEKNQTTCNLEVFSPFDATIPIPDVSLGNLNCEKTNLWKYFLEIDKLGVANGVRIIPILILITLVTVLILTKKNKKLNNSIKRLNHA